MSAAAVHSSDALEIRDLLHYQLAAMKDLLDRADYHARECRFERVGEELGELRHQLHKAAGLTSHGIGRVHYPRQPELKLFTGAASCS